MFFLQIKYQGGGLEGDGTPQKIYHRFREDRFKGQAGYLRKAPAEGCARHPARPHHGITAIRNEIKTDG